MRIIWKLEPEEVVRLQEFVASRSSDLVVKGRMHRNILEPPKTVEHSAFWMALVGCLFTSQQRSGPDSYVSRLLAAEPFALPYSLLSRPDPLAAVGAVLANYPGIRFRTKIVQQLVENYQRLESGLWSETHEVLCSLIGADSPAAERKAAAFLDENRLGLGPEQSRNLLQDLGLAKYEIPIDSRVTKWLKAFGFPLVVRSELLSYSAYYNLVSDGVQEMCRQCEIVPCVLDAVIFSSFDQDIYYAAS